MKTCHKLKIFTDHISNIVLVSRIYKPSKFTVRKQTA